MPEIPRWLIVSVAVVVVGWIITQTAGFVGKVSTTVGKANQSIETQQTDFSKTMNQNY
ncbi:MAG: hypothetical protein ACI4SM_04400 [Candidatus Gastranaerophilaceae bacterium]